MSELFIRIEDAAFARHVAQRIRQESATYTQVNWTTDCKTPACIAGHAAEATLREGEFLDDAMVRGRNVESIPARAAQALGLDDDWLDNPLFSARPQIEWPAPSGERYANAPTPEARAKVAADLLERLADEAHVRAEREEL